jgi:quinolinate synthase
MVTLTSISKNSLAGTQQPDTLRAPEVEKGVGCDFDSYLLVPDNTLDERIAAAKASLGKDVVILGHHYQRDEVVKFADFRGDSLKLSQQAGEADSKYIVFCGVHFMAESADILRRDQQVVVLPDLNAGCSMADMADIGQVESCWGELATVLDTRKIVPVTYMNSTAAIKSFTGENGGSVCTSSNAAAVMKWAFAHGEKVLFLPDEHLGRNTGYRMGIALNEMLVWDPYQELGGNTPEALQKAKIILWKGYCSVHQRFLPEHVAKVRREHPGIRVIVHPECRFEVAQAADEIGSTEGI